MRASSATRSSRSSHATVVTYDPRGAGASDRPERGYTFPLHAADAVAVMDEVGFDRAARRRRIARPERGRPPRHGAPERVSASPRSRRTCSSSRSPSRRIRARLEAWRTDWRGFIDPFMHAVFTEPDSDRGHRADDRHRHGGVARRRRASETELEWTDPARRLGAVACPMLVIHGEADAAVPLSLAQSITAAVPHAQLVVIPDGGHRPDIRSPELVNPLLIEFLLAT